MPPTERWLPQASPPAGVACRVKSRAHLDPGQDILEQAGVHIERFRKRSEKTRRQVEKVVRTTAQQALVRGARTLRRQADDLQAGLKKLSSKLARLEHGRKPARRATGSAKASARKRPAVSTRRPRQKKAA